jgi:hypothetical protein
LQLARLRPFRQTARPFWCNYQRGGFAVLSVTAAKLQSVETCLA